MGNGWSKHCRGRAVLGVVLMVLAAAGISFAGEHGGGAAHWGYEGEAGPGHWGEMKGEYALCGTGTAQSPVDIKGDMKAAPAPLKLAYKDAPLGIINNGHTIQVNYAPGSTAVIGGKEYQLIQFHFHTPSENTIEGRAFAMEAHLVHKAADGELAVIGVMMAEGAENAFIKTLWNCLPHEEGAEKKTEGVSVNAKELLPRDLGYYSFTGSLTTPPCSEGVKWTVLKDPIEVSAEQIKQFAELFPMNARPVQPLNGRPISAGR